MTDRWRVAAGLAVILWLTVFFVGYFYTHKPVAPGQAAVLGRLLLTLTAWLGTIVLAHGLGAVADPLLGGAPGRERFALRVGLGLGALGLIMLALGALGLFRPAVAWGIWAVGVAAGLRGFARQLPAALPRLPARRADRWLAAFVVVSLGLSFVAALTPPTAWDSLVYHLNGPKLYIAAGRLHHDLDLPYLGFPHWPAMLYTWALLLGDPAGAQLVHFTFALLTLALMPGLAARLAPGRAWLSAALLLSAPALALLAGWAYAEWMMMFAITAGAAAALSWQHCREGRWLAVAGVMTGLAIAAKYTAAGAILGLAGAVLVIVSEKSKERSGATSESLTSESLARSLLLFGGATLATASPWLIKNWVLTGNPVYPFFFPGEHWDAFRAEWYGRPGTGLGLLETLAAPWSLMVGGAREEDVGPLLLPLLPLLIVGWRARSPDKRRAIRLLLTVVGVAAVVWLIGLASSHLLYQIRLLYAVFPLLAVLGAASFDGLAALSTTALRARWVVGGLIGLALALNLSSRVLAFAADSPVGVAVGAEPRGDYLNRRLGVYFPAMQAVNNLPAGHRVVFLWEPRSFYCLDGCEPDALLDRWWRLRRTLGGAGAIAERWRAEGVTHVLIFESGRAFVEGEGFDPLTATDWAELDRLVAEDLKPALDLQGAYRLYALSP